MRQRSTRRTRKRLYIKTLIFMLVILLMFAAIIVFDRYEKSTREASYGNLDERFAKDNITYNGAEYTPKTGLTTFLFMGIDTSEETGAYNGAYRSGGQCDFLMLTIIDTHNKSVTRLQIDRDTIAPITVLGVLGNDLGTSEHQICLAHGFGDGKEQSCQFTVDAVQRLLNGVEIDGYYAMNLDGIPQLNELLGGVTVKIEDDFSAIDPSMAPGAEVTLHGDQTELFVRRRVDIGDGTNFSRMRRQRQFMNNAITLAFERIKQDNKFFNTLLNGLEPYITTDITRGRMINEGNRAAAFTVGETIYPEGEYALGDDGFMEFRADKEALTELVLELFYEPV